MSLTKQHLEPLVENLFSEMRTRVREIERETKGRGETAKAVCDYVGAAVAAESKSLVSTLYTKLSEETLGKEPFLSVRNKNKFYEKDIWSAIFDKYSFSTTEKINYEEAGANSSANSFTLPLGAAGVGIVLSIAFKSAIIIPVALVVAVALYRFINANRQNSNTENFVLAVDSYLETIRRELMSWFENIETFYHEQVVEVIASLKD